MLPSAGLETAFELLSGLRHDELRAIAGPVADAAVELLGVAPTFFVRKLADYELVHQFIDKGDQMGFFRTRPLEAKAISAITSRASYR